MALVGHISGSTQSNSLIAVSGTVIVANRPDALFPSSLPGSDVSFFVSGSRGGKGAASRTVSVFGGDAVVSGSLTIGTGSLTITSNDIQFSSPSNRIELSGNDIIFFDGNNTGGKTLTQLASAAPGGVGGDTQVQYNDAGTISGESTFTYNKNTDTLSVVNSVMTAVTAAYIVPNSSVNSFIVNLQGDLKLTGNDIIASDDSYSIQLEGSSNVKIGGDLTVGGNDIKASNGTTALTLDTSGNVSVAGDLTVTGNDIKSSAGQTAITLAGASVIIPGDLTVNGAMTTVDTQNLEVKDGVVGFGFSSGTIAVTAGDRGWIGGILGANNVMNKWDSNASEFVFARTTSSATGSFSIASYANLQVNNLKGNIITASLGFSGSHTKLADGTSAFVAGSGIQITSASNGAVTITSTASTSPGGSNTSVQFNDSNAFGGTAFFTFDKNSGAGGQGKLSVNETLSTTLTSSTIIGGASSVNLFTNSTTTSITAGSVGGSTSFQGNVTGSNFLASGDIAVNGGDITTTASTFNLLNTTATTLNLGGAATAITMGDSTTATTTIRGGTLVGNTATQNLFNTTAAAINIGGAATTMQIGHTTAGTATVLSVGGASNSGAGGNSTISASTGSFSRLTIGAGPNTIAGVTTFTGASNTTTLQGSGSISGALLVAGNTTLGATSANTVTVNGTTTFAGASVTTTLAGSGSISGNLSVGGSTTLGNGSDDTVTFTAQVASNVLPSADRLYNLGSPTFRWNNVYTGDLHLRNERGNWTVIEEETYLSIRNNHTGKMYKFVLEEIVDPVGE